MAAAIAAAVLAHHGKPLELRGALLDIPSLRHRGKGRGAPSRRYGHQAGRYVPHEGLQERLRRQIGGWALRPFPHEEHGPGRSLTKNQALDDSRFRDRRHAAHFYLTGERLA